jgi:flagellar basal body-associated protein FliL
MKLRIQISKNMKKKPKNQKGYIGFIALLIALVLAALFLAYLMRYQWFNVPNITEKSNTAVNSGEQKTIPVQLDDLRANMKNITGKKDQEINNALK